MTSTAGGPPNDVPTPRMGKRSGPHGFPALNPAAAVPVTRAMVRDRASQLATGRGRPAHEANKSDWEEARRQLSPETVPESVPAPLADGSLDDLGSALLETEDPFASEAADAALDERERSDQETLVIEGMASAERDLRDRAGTDPEGDPLDDRNP